MCTYFVAVYGVLMRIFFQLRYAKKKKVFLLMRGCVHAPGRLLETIIKH